MKRTINFLILGLLLTTAYSQTWTKLNLPNTDQHFTDIKLGQDGNLYLLTSQGLYQSTDDGDNWSLYDAGARNSDSKLGDELMTVTKDGMVFIDKALTINQTDGDSLKRTKYYTLGGYQRSAQMVSLSTGEIIRAYRDNWGPNNVFYSISKDNGVTWEDKKTSSAFALQNFKHPIFFVGENDDIYYVGADKSLFRSTDKGESYTSSGNTTVAWDDKLSTLDTKTGIFYVVSRVGLYWKLNKSVDHGATWTDIPLASNQSITSINVYDNKIILSTNFYISYSDDGGSTWIDKSSMFQTGQFPEKYILNKSDEILALNSAGNGVVLIDFGTSTVTPKVSGIDNGSANSHHYNGSRLAASFSGYAYYSDDEGATWTKLKGEGAHCGGIYVSSNNTVYTSSTASGTWSGVYYQDVNDSMVAVSADSGSVWNMSKENSMFEDDKGNIYCVSNLYGLYKSSDGKGFVRQSEAPFNDLGASQTVWFDKNSKRIFGYNGAGGDTYYSDDYGVTWEQGNDVTDMNFPSHIHFSGGSKFWTYVWTTKVEQHGVYSSSDGKSWNGPIGSTQNFDNRYDQLIKGNKESQMFMASTRGYVQVSNDTGKTWTLFENGLDSFDILDRTDMTSKFVPVVRMTASGGKLILATSGSLYMADMDGGTTNNVLSKSHINMNVYPNPVKERLNIDTESKVLNCSIIDLSGKEVFQSEINGSSIDVADIESGFYILKVMTNNGLSNSKIYIKH